MQWEVLSKTDAADITAGWQNKSMAAFSDMVKIWPSIIEKELNNEYLNLRKAIVSSYQQAKKDVANEYAKSGKTEYMTDLLFGVRLYELLKKYQFNVRFASNDQIWIYLSVKVVPDIVNKRFPGTSTKSGTETLHRNINEERFWKTKRRIYLRVLWWYIYLSLQYDENGNEDPVRTIEILNDNTTDEIVQLVERPGPAGYRVEVYRELMRFYAENRTKYANRFFRQVMVLNTARTKVIEPALMSGGISEYVEELFEYFNE